VLRAALDAVTGYGQHALHTVRQLRRLGVEVRVEPLWIWEDPCPLPADIRPHLQPGPGGEAWELLLGVPMEDPPTDRARVRFTMWESGRLPAGCVERLNRSAAVLVPCRWNQLCFDAAGVRVPLHRVPMGLDPEVFSPRSWPSGPFTFGAGGRLSHGGVRKGVAQVAWAFHRAFPPEEEVRLQLKVHGDCDLQALPPDPRITLLRESWNEERMARWFGGLHVYVTMAAAEGFGFMPLQAMACGRPVIAAIEHGHAEYMTPETVLEVPAGLTRAELEAGPRWEYAGYWFPPEEDAVIARMRECYAADPAELEALGLRAAAQAGWFTWDRYGDGLVAALRAAGAVLRPQDLGR
jgi:glycosyltransferase involved in cell wall biosynthesis